MLFFRATLIMVLLASTAHAETFRVKSGDSYYDYTVSEKGYAEAIDEKLTADARPKIEVKYIPYTPNPNWTAPEGGEVIIEKCDENGTTGWQVTTEAKAKAYTQDRLGSEGWKIATAPANSTYHTIVDERPCFYEAIAR